MRIVLADDHELVRFAVRDVLGAEPDIDVVGEARDGSEAVTLVKEHAPDVVMLDLRMPGMDGIEACRAITTESPDTRVLVMSSFDDATDVDAALSAGACGYILKDTSPQGLVHALRDVASGRVVLDRGVARHAISPPRPLEEPDLLSEREAEVLDLMALGLRNRDIAQRLWISEPTVKTHVSRVIHKLGQQDRTQAVLEAMKRGLVTATGDNARHPRG